MLGVPHRSCAVFGPFLRSPARRLILSQFRRKPSPDTALTGVPPTVAPGTKSALGINRPAEFAARGPQPLAPIVAELLRVVERARSIISNMDAASLSRRYGVQGYDVSGLQAIFHVAEHISFHSGQIVHITKTIRDVDLSLYDAQGRRRTPAGGKPW